MEHIRKMVQPIYDSGDLLGFSICGDTGQMVYNESFFNDEVAWQATAPFVRVARQMEKAERAVNRLTVELDDVILIYDKRDEGHVLYTLEHDCDLRRVTAALS